MENLNKENFWNEMYAKYPIGVQKFCDWIDGYKKDNDWDKLFNGNLDLAYRTNEGTGPWDVMDAPSKAPKFHDLPFGIQHGVLIQFFLENGFTYWHVDIASHKWRDCFEEMFSELNSAQT